jgi:U32 family peptidase
MNKPELLMPAGNLEKLKIAVKNGADAVYFGASRYNMRSPAQNFTREEVKEGIDFCHAYGSKAYMTMNIALKDQEIKDAVEMAKVFYEFGLDALIIQDMGLFKILREAIPDLDLHASTQLTCNNRQGAEFLAELGFKKVVLARELTIEEIIEITRLLHEQGVESEVFVHGAECFSYSGQCLFSSFVFNKSGNRGRCLQPCRLPYETNTGNKGRILSMKDLCTYEIVDQLIEAGIDSFKIEGRLKSEEYIQNVARVYRKQIDKYYNKDLAPPKKGEIVEMKKSYLRDHGNLYLKHDEENTTITTLGSLGLPACKVIGFKGKAPIVEILNDVNKSDKLTRIQDEDYENLFLIGLSNQGTELQFARPGQKVVLKFRERPFLEVGETLYLTTPKQFNAGKSLLIEYDLSVTALKGENIRISVNIPQMQNKLKFEYDFKVDTAEKIATTKEVIEDKLFQQYYFFKQGNFECQIDKGSFIPLSKLKDLKRTIAKKIKSDLFPQKEVIKNYDEIVAKAFDLPAPKEEKFLYKDQKMFTFVDEIKEEIIDKTQELATEKIYYYNDEKGSKNAFKNGAYVKAQNIQSSYNIEDFEKAAVANNWTVVASNIGTVWIAIKNGLKFIVDRELNCYNSVAISFYLDYGAEKVVPSIELSLEEISKINNRDKLILLAFYYPVLMTSRAYEEKNIFGKNKMTLLDRKDYEYRVRFENKLMKIYNPMPVDMLYELERLNQYQNIGIDLKETHTPEAIALLKFYVDKINKRNPSKKSKFTRGHYDKAVV